MIEFITSFINGKNNDIKFRKQKANNDNKKLFLLVLDNIEGIIRDDESELHYFLYVLDQDCKNLKVIFTSYRTYTKFEPDLFYPYEDETPQSIVVKKLSDIDSVNLFFSENTIIPSPEEVLAFLQKDPNYPYKELVRIS